MYVQAEYSGLLEEVDYGEWDDGEQLCSLASTPLTLKLVSHTLAVRRRVDHP